MKISYLVILLGCLSFSGNIHAELKSRIVCELSDCEVIAFPKENIYKKANGFEVLVPPEFKFGISITPKKMTKLNRSIVVEGGKGKVYVISEVSLDDFGLNVLDKITIYSFFHSIFMQKFSNLDANEISSNTLVAIKSFKIATNISSKDSLTYFSRTGLSIFSYYDPVSTNYEIYVVSKPNHKLGQQITMIGSSREEFVELISTIIRK